MFIPAELGPNEVRFVKLVATKEARGGNVEKELNQTRDVTIEGFSENGDILFRYDNKDQNLT